LGGEDTRIRIYIDQGHNPTSYHNAGAVGNGYYEQDITFTVGKLLAERLKADGRFAVCLSRPFSTTVLGTDNDSSLDARVEGAKDFGADYFISLHTNAYTNDTASGFEIYTVKNNDESYRFGDYLRPYLAAATNLRDRGMKQSSDIRVLNNATMPAILIEMGFISNPADASLMAEHPEIFADAIYEGMLSYFDLSAPAVGE
jgi:N-acetylmuramoyl-L-alanine amidase